MKINEFRDKVSKAEREDLEKIAAELYKAIPKARKEAETDALIEGILEHKDVKKKKNSAESVDFDTLKKEIEAFLTRVDNNLYYMPNRVVPKSKRSQWRFEVKSFIKQIDMIPGDGDNGPESARLLREIYKRLAYGCGYYIFPSDDPFRSVGIRQPVLYEKMIKRTFASGFEDEKIRNMLLDATTCYIDRQSLHIELEMIFAGALNTSDMKHKAIEIIRELVPEYEKKRDASRPYSSQFYNSARAAEELCETFLCIAIMLGEPDEAIGYYWKHAKDSDNEITLYKLLDTIALFEDRDLWIMTYEDALKKKIKPRDYLQEKYRKLTNPSAITDDQS